MDILSKAAHPPHVMIVSDDPMGGHRAAANAVNDALHNLDTSSPPIDSKVYEIYELSSPARRASRERWNPANMAAGEARTAFQRSMNPSFFTLLRWKYMTPFWKDREFPEGRGAVEKANPDLLLSVHMDTNALANAWRRRGVLHGPTHSVVTDYIAHFVWASKTVQRYYVASEDVKKDLVNYGVKATRIKVTGIPISPAMAAPDNRPKEAVKEKLGLDPKLPVVLILGGSRGDQKYLDIMRALAARGNTAQVVAVCGRNEVQRQAVENSQQEFQYPVYARPFVDMVDYYNVADVVITKPGGLTMSELFAKGKAAIMVSPYPGMEEAQVERLNASQVALYGDSPERAGELAVSLLGDSRARAELEARARAFGHPDAAATIARDIQATVCPAASARWITRAA